MKYAPVVPVYALDGVPVGHDYHLVLSDQLMVSSLLRNYYRNRSQSGAMVIMDNPVHERLMIPPFSVRCALSIDVRPTVAVCPDAIGEAETSYKMYIEERALRSYQPLMAVVQGRTWTEYMFSITHLAMSGATYIGIPLIRRFKKISRADFVNELTRRGFFEQFPHVQIHLLGADSTFDDAKELRNHPNVMGVDSAKPVYLGIKGVCIESAKEADWGRPKDYFKPPFPQFMLTNAQVEVIKHNIEVVSEWVSNRSSVTLLSKTTCYCCRLAPEFVGVLTENMGFWTCEGCRLRQAYEGKCGHPTLTGVRGIVRA